MAHSAALLTWYGVCSRQEAGRAAACTLLAGVPRAGGWERRGTGAPSELVGGSHVQQLMLPIAETAHPRTWGLCAQPHEGKLVSEGLPPCCAPPGMLRIATGAMCSPREAPQPVSHASQPGRPGWTHGQALSMSHLLTIFGRRSLLSASRSGSHDTRPPLPNPSHRATELDWNSRIAAVRTRWGRISGREHACRCFLKVNCCRRSPPPSSRSQHAPLNSAQHHFRRLALPKLSQSR